MYEYLEGILDLHFAVGTGSMEKKTIHSQLSVYNVELNHYYRQIQFYFYH